MLSKLLMLWSKFIADMEAGKRIVVVFIIGIIVLAIVIKHQDSRITLLNKEKSLLQEQSNIREAKIRDSTGAIIYRILQTCNAEKEAIYKQQLERFNEIKRNNERIIKKTVQ